jgi:phage tail sheath protein FI
MSIYLSPGVYSQEKDISDIVQRVASAPAALVGYSAKGDTGNILLMTNDQQFIEEYGKPDASTGHYFHYAALAYLKKGNSLYTLRVENGALWGGVNIMATTSSEVNAALGTGQSSTTFSEPSGMSGDVLFQILGKDPGVWNNRVGVIVQNVKDGSNPVPTDQYTFEILVYWQDDDGNWAQVEKWIVSRKRKVDGYGRQLYLTDRINGVSKYIYVADSALANTVLPKPQATRLALTGGSDGSDTSSSDMISGWNDFLNPDNVDVRILINGGETEVPVQTAMRDVAEARMDCIAVLDMPYASTSSAVSMNTFRTTTQNFNTSYAALYSPWPKIHDAYNDILIQVPPSGYVAAQYAYNDQVAAVWNAPAGPNRGVLDDALEVTLSTGAILSVGDRDLLNPNQVNVLQTFRGEGHMIYGQRTLQRKLSALSFVNVRRLLIVIEKSIAVSLRSFVFEPNSALTRFRVEAMLVEYLDQLSAQGAFQTEGGDRGYHVVCDDLNNTPTTIDLGELRVDVFVKPSRAVEFIKLQTIVTSTGASFEELQARGGLL